MGVWKQQSRMLIRERPFSRSFHYCKKTKGKSAASVQGGGKSQLGQRVNVRINNFPDQEFGYLIGTVQSISNVPTAGGFLCG